MLYYLLATVCQDGSAWNEREMFQHFYQLVLNMVWDLWKSYARTFRCLELLRWERTSSKVQCEPLLAGSFIVLCWTLNLHWYVLLGSNKKSQATITELLLFCKSAGVILRDALLSLQRLCANGSFEDCQVWMFVKQHVLPSANISDTAEQAGPRVTC